MKTNLISNLTEKVQPEFEMSEYIKDKMSGSDQEIDQCQGQKIEVNTLNYKMNGKMTFTDMVVWFKADDLMQQQIQVTQKSVQSEDPCRPINKLIFYYQRLEDKSRNLE